MSPEPSRISRVDDPKIGDVVDVEAWPYVVPQSWAIPTYAGTVALPRGLLGDGASGFLIRDLDPETFFPHDRLYICPMITPRGDPGKVAAPVRIGKIKCDLIYAHMLIRRWHIAPAVIRPIGLLTLPTSWRIWREYRRKERESPEWWTLPLDQGGRFVPWRDSWHFQNWRTAFAIWDPTLSPPLTLQGEAGPLVPVS